MRRERLLILVLSVFLLILAGAGCKKKPAPAPPPPPPPPAAEKPTATLRVNPTSIERGQSTTLEWSTTNSSSVAIEPDVGSVEASGSRSVKPTESTTYRLTAKGPGGEATATARVTVTTPPPPPAPAPTTRGPSEEELFLQNVRPIYFDYDKSDIRDDQRPTLQANGEFLRAHPNINIIIEGHCDERGSAEYNIGLGDRRANSAKEFLVSMGISTDRIRTISYGKERPVCTESNEDCWQKNRRAQFVLVR